MTSTNIWQRFKGILPATSRTVVTITANNGNGTSNAMLRNGSVVVVEGESVAAGSNALVIEGKVIGTAPALMQYENEI